MILLQLYIILCQPMLIYSVTSC